MSKQRFAGTIVAGAVLVALALGGCGSTASSAGGYAAYQSKPTYGGTFHIAFQTDIPELDPLTWTDLQSMYPMLQIYDTLVRYDYNSTKIVPDVANWTSSPNGLVYTFHLRNGVRFSNGHPLTAQDVKFSLDRLTSHANAGVSGYGSYFAMIKGFAGWNDGKITTGLSGIQVVNDHELKFTLNYPAPYFLNVLALQAADITDPAVVNQWGNLAYSAHAVGTGPFMLKKWVRNTEMILVRNPYYWGPKPYLKEIDIEIGPNPTLAFEKFQLGQLDATTNGGVSSEITSANYLQIQANPKLKALYHRTPENGMMFVDLNSKVGPTANVLVRQAINYAIDQQQLIKTLTNGRGGVMTNAVMPPEMPGFQKGLPPLYAYNLQKANELMRQAGYQKGFTTTFIGWTDPTTTKLADFLQAQLKKINITVNIRTMTYPQFLGVAANPNNFGLAEYGWFQDYPDPQDFFDALYNQNAFGATNFTYWKNAEAQHLITEADRMPASQDSQRYVLYQRAQSIVASQAPVLFEYTLWMDALVQPWVGPKNVNAWGLGPVYPIEFNRVWIAKH